MSDPVTTGPRWRGAHHVALTTPDLDATVRFYHGLLGLPLVGGKGANPVHGRHYAFDAGGFLIGFFEQPAHGAPAAPAGWSRAFGFLPGAFQHLALVVADEEGLEALRARLVAAGVEVTEWLHEGPMRQFLFADNNGIVWEATWTPAGAEAVPPGWAFDDPDPVPAARKLRAAGQLRG
jgi:catechol 2,3-dioxygenase-like lactoylglutathione lyase family enzyme